MAWYLAAAAILLGVLGIVGSIVPGLPGPPLSWLGLLVCYLAKGPGKDALPMSTTFLLVWLGITVAVTILDYIVPAKFTRLTGGSKYAGWGAMAGLLAGLFFTPVGILTGTFLGAFLFELLFASKTGLESAKAALGAFLGFICGTGAKLAASGVMLYYIIVYL